MNPAIVALEAFLAVVFLAGAGAAALTRAEGPGPGVVATLGTLVQPEKPEERQDLRAQLTRAGLYGKRSVELYLAAKAVLLFATPALLWFAWQPANPVFVAASVICGAALGYYAPPAFVRYWTRRRQRLLRVAFPNALDMLVSCVEAGLGLDLALRCVARDFASAAPEFSRELSLVNTELGAGVARVDALRHLHERTGLEDVGALVTVLGQAERYGSHVAEALRTHAQLTRARRLLEAERRACEATPKLTVVMIIFVLPPLFIVVLGPTIVNLAERFGAMMGG